MEDLESKIHDELATLKTQLETIQISSSKFSDLEDLRRKTEERRNRLLLEQEDLVEKKHEIQAQIHTLQNQCDLLQVTSDAY